MLSNINSEGTGCNIQNTSNIKTRLNKVLLQDFALSKTCEYTSVLSSGKHIHVHCKKSIRFLYILNRLVHLLRTVRILEEKKNTLTDSMILCK